MSATKVHLWGRRCLQIGVYLLRRGVHLPRSFPLLQCQSWSSFTDGSSWDGGETLALGAFESRNFEDELERWTTTQRVRENMETTIKTDGDGVRSMQSSKELEWEGLRHLSPGRWMVRTITWDGTPGVENDPTRRGSTEYDQCLLCGRRQEAVPRSPRMEHRPTRTVIPIWLTSSTASGLPLFSLPVEDLLFKPLHSSTAHAPCFPAHASIARRGSGSVSLPSSAVHVHFDRFGPSIHTFVLSFWRAIAT